MTKCPDLRSLLAAPPAPDILAHLAGCPGCQAIVAVANLRTLPRDSRPESECATFEPALAALSESKLGSEERTKLARHLTLCAACRTVAMRLALADVEEIPTDKERAR